MANLRPPQETALQGRPVGRFYHSVDLPGIGTIDGDWDLRGRFDDYVGNVELKNKRVLDVGTASGFLSFEAEKRGAIVTSFDADTPERWQVGPGTKLDRRYFEEMRASYRFSHDAFRSSASTVYGDVYNLSELTHPHDIVIVGQILVHLRDPLEAIEQACKCALERIVISEGMIDTEDPVASFIGGKDAYGWWRLSRGTYRQWLYRLGFSIEKAAVASYTCRARNIEMPIWTIVAARQR